jgi:cytochrome c biogenesis protein CcdA
VSTLTIAFLAGVLTILSPCVLPLTPILVAGGRATDPRGPLALAAGLALTFGIVGGLLASFGVEVGASDHVRWISAAIMLAVGLILLVPALNDRAERLLAPASGAADALRGRLPVAGLAGQAATGAILAFAWAPCAGPTLGAAFALAASGGSLLAAMATMAAFALGAASSLLAVGYGLGRLAAKGRGIVRRAGAIGRFALGGAFAAIGALMLTGLDRQVEAYLITIMPDWLTAFAAQL